MAEIAFEKKFPFAMLGFDSEGARQHGKELVGTCLFCGKEDKLFINTDTGQWSCKGGECGLEGNVYTFIKEYYGKLCHVPTKGNPAVQARFIALVRQRELPAEKMLEKGLRWSPELERWVIPVYNVDGKIVNLQLWLSGLKPIMLTGMDTSLGNLETWNEKDDYPVYQTEGPWDAWALETMLETAMEKGTVLWVPGCDVFKKGWEKYIQGRDWIICYDHDTAGERGTQRLFSKYGSFAKRFRHISWPKDLDKGFDVRDLYKRNGTMETVREMLTEFKVPDAPGKVALVSFPKLTDGKRPTFDETVEIYKKHMSFNEDMKKGLKIMFAISYAQNLKGRSPLWLHVAGPPSCGKTELLMTLASAGNVEVRSTVTARSLVSGFSLPGGKDPSVLPQLYGKLFVLKDFTEILQMNKAEQEEVDSILRGAYDGVVTKQFGNGVIRHYEGTFNMVTGVTQEIFAQAHTSLGERFLIYHMVKGVGIEHDDVIRAAIRSSGKEAAMKKEMADAAKAFLEFSFDEEDVPEIPQEFEDRIMYLSYIVSVLRGSVRRDYRQENIIFRPQHEHSSRLAKQFFFLLSCLGMCNPDFKVTEEDYEIVMRVGMDSCRGFNLEIMNYVASNPGCRAKEVAEAMSVPLSTIRLQLDDLEHLGAISKSIEEEPEDGRGKGQPSKVYELTEFQRRNWEGATMYKTKEIKSEKPKFRWKFNKTK